ncbi:MAG: tetratricopeptide repeat protein, partial [Nitrospirales bacterium]
LASTDRWLLVLDHVKTPAVRALLSPPLTGHAVLTLRRSDLALVESHVPVELGPLSVEEAVTFLFKRTGRRKTESEERAAATALARELEGYPWALELAGAFVSATSIAFRDYVLRLRQTSEQLGPVRDAPEGIPRSVRAVWSVTLQEIHAESKSAGELASLLACLHPDPVPEALLAQAVADQEPDPGETPGAKEQEQDESRVESVVATWARYAIVSRGADPRTIRMSRMVQASLRSQIPEAERPQWVQRAIRLLNRVFLVSYSDGAITDPGPVSVTRAVSHVLAVNSLATSWGLDGKEVADLIHRFGLYAKQQGCLEEAESRLKQALATFERVLGRHDPRVAVVLRDWAVLELAQGKVAEAEPLLKRAGFITQNALPPDHPDQAHVLHALARLAHAKRQFPEAESLYYQAIGIWEQHDQVDSTDLAAALNNLATLYHAEKLYLRAEPLLRRAVMLVRKALPPDHPELAVCLQNLAALYHAQRRYAAAEPFYRESLKIRERCLGPDHPDLLPSVEDYAVVLRKVKRKRDAAVLAARAKRLQTVRKQSPLSTPAST